MGSAYRVAVPLVLLVLGAAPSWAGTADEPPSTMTIGATPPAQACSNSNPEFLTVQVIVTHSSDGKSITASLPEKAFVCVTGFPWKVRWQALDDRPDLPTKLVVADKLVQGSCETGHFYLEGNDTGRVFTPAVKNDPQAGDCWSYKVTVTDSAGASFLVDPQIVWC
jgi:hypothetical protein